MKYRSEYAANEALAATPLAVSHVQGRHHVRRTGWLAPLYYWLTQ